MICSVGEGRKNRKILTTAQLTNIARKSPGGLSLSTADLSLSRLVSRLHEEMERPLYHADHVL